MGALSCLRAGTFRHAGLFRDLTVAAGALIFKRTDGASRQRS